MTRSANATTDRFVPMAFRHLESRRLMLEVIQKREGHGDLSQTIRDAVDEYIDRHLLRPEKVA
jgi:hypothetical protein